MGVPSPRKAEVPIMVMGPAVNPSTRKSKGLCPPGSPTSSCCGLRITSAIPASSAVAARKLLLMDYASALFTRPLLLALVLLLSNYLGHFHPILWTASNRHALLAIFSHPLAQSFSSSTSSPSSASLGDTSSLLDPTLTDGAMPITRDAVSDPTPAGEEGRGGAASEGDSEAGPSLSPKEPQQPWSNPWIAAVPKQASCKKIFPHNLVRGSRGPVAFVGDLVQRRRERLLLTIPRHGLGNSLRGFVSSVVYAALSGRRLIRFHGAEHAKVFDTLCRSFRCGFESIEASDGVAGPMDIYRQLELLSPIDLNSKYKHNSVQILGSLRSTQGLLVSKSPHFYDGFWQHFPLVRQCVYDALGCTNTWCVRARALQSLIGRPTPLLEAVIQKILKRHVSRGVEVSAERDSSKVFDIAIHFRTRPASIESKHPGEEKRQELMRIGCEDKGSAGESKSSSKSTTGSESQSKGGSEFLKGCLWDCLGSILERVQEQRGKKGQPLEILVATDNEPLRADFVERLAPYGTVYYSSGVIVHSSKSASVEVERLPTMAEFHLMSKSHTILEAGSYISTFAYFSGLLGNTTLSGIDWLPQGGCDLKVVHRGDSDLARHKK